MSTIYQKIGALLFSIAPKNSKKTVLNAELSDDGTVGTFKYKSLDVSGSEQYFAGGGLINQKMLDLMNELRAEYVINGDGAWKSCIFILDLETEKFEMDFKYLD